MIRELAQCPYCQRCEVALDDHPALVFNPDGDGRPCPHLAWVDGRYSDWELTPRGVNRVIGSLEFRWDPDEPDAAERTEELLPYLRELLDAGPGWPFAPAVPFTAAPLRAEQTAVDGRGKSYTVWEVDGWALFAQSPAAFWADLPACRDRQLASLRVEEEGG
jgi:hypothetical protein